MERIDPDPHGGPIKPDKPTDRLSGLSDLLANKWIWVGGIGLLLLKGKCLLAGGAGLAAGYYLRGKEKQGEKQKQTTYLWNPKN
jgi:hypothetical protein